MAEEVCEYRMFPESVVLSFWYGPGYKACRKMACRKMNEYVTYARNTESGCNSKLNEKSWLIT